MYQPRVATPASAIPALALAVAMEMVGPEVAVELDEVTAVVELGEAKVVEKSVILATVEAVG